MQRRAAVKGLSLGGGLRGRRGQRLELKLGSFIPACVQRPLGGLNRAAAGRRLGQSLAERRRERDEGSG